MYSSDEETSGALCAKLTTGATVLNLPTPLASRREPYFFGTNTMCSSQADHVRPIKNVKNYVAPRRKVITRFH